MGLVPYTFSRFREIAAFERFLTRERSSRFNGFQRGGGAPVIDKGLETGLRKGHEFDFEELREG